MKDVAKQPYSEWLEETLHDLVDLQPVSIGFVMIMPDGAAETRYYNADTRDITIFCEAFGIDYLSRVLEANIDNIKRLLEEGE